MPEINVRQRFNQSPKQVFAALSTHASLNQLFWPVQVVRSRDAADPQNLDGVGSVRKIGFGPIKPLTEQIVSFEPNQMIEYKIIGQTPVKDHLGRLTFMPDGQGTLVDYHIELDSDIPLLAPAILAGLQFVIRTGLSRMARTLA